MQIIDLNDYHKDTYFKCLEDWSDEMDEAGSKKTSWYNIYKDKGLRVKLALSENNSVAGMIQYIPIENSFVEGENLYFIYCIWIHGYKKGIGNYQHRGMGKALLQNAEDDARELGARGMVAWGLSLPFWMKASWFRKQGYKKADKDGIAQLLWKPFDENAIKPHWMKNVKKPENEEGKVIVTSFVNGWCPALNLSYERAKRAAEEIGKPVEFKEINTIEEDNLKEWGIVDALYIDGKSINTGPPPSYEKIKKKIVKQLDKKKLS